MKPFHLLLVLLATLFFCSDLNAQSRDRGIGRGRILKRLKEDLFGQSNYQKPNYKAKAPTPANKKQPTSARQPTPATRKSTTPSIKQPVPAGTPAVVNNSGKNGSGIDFGMAIKENRSGDLVVSYVNPRGNAFKKGVRVGDVIKEVGGAELTSPDELDSIVDILNQGDQLEFGIQSSGSQTREVIIQYGTTPVADTELVKTGKPVEKQQGMSSILPTSSRNGMRSVLDNQVQSNYQTNRTNQGRGYYGSDFERQRQIELLRRQLQVLEQRGNQRYSAPSVNGPGR